MTELITPDIPLPNKPSELIRISLEDIERVERDSRYRIEMGDWHVPAERGDLGDLPRKCEVCAAGSIMAMRLGADPDDERSPSHYDHATEQKLCAVDSLRMGHVSSAISESGGVMTEDERSSVQSAADKEGVSTIYPYYSDPAQFKEDMLQLADWLEARDL